MHVREGEAPAEPGLFSLFSFWWLGGSFALPAAFGNKKTRRSEIWFSLRRAHDRAARMNQLTS